MGQGNKSRRKGGSGSHGHTGTKKHRGPRHGHGNKGKSGGGNAYGTNNINMTISQAKKIYANQLAAGYSLQEAMKHNKAETVRFSDLLDDKGDTKKTNSTNNMATQTDQEWLNEKYQETFGRDASFGTTGGAQYWLDQMASNPTSHTRDEVLRMLQGSQEGTKYAASVAAGNPTVKIGGLESNLSTHSQGQETFADGTTNPNYNVWAGHFQDGGSLQGGSSAAAANAIAAATGQPGNFFQQADADIISKLDTQGTNVKTGDDATAAQDGWWNQFADADAFKDFLKGDSSDQGMGDFMKFMMLMSVMGGGQGMGGGGYGGSSYGYGGLTPGGVMQANDPWSKMKDGFSWFKDSFGSGTGSGTTSDNLNVTGTA